MEGIERRDRSVRHQDVRFHRQRTREHHACSLAAGKCIDLMIQQVFDIGVLNSPIDRPLVRGGGRSHMKPAERDHLARAQPPMQHVALRKNASRESMSAKPLCLLAVQLHRAARQRQQSAKRMQ